MKRGLLIIGFLIVLVSLGFVLGACTDDDGGINYGQQGLTVDEVNTSIDYCLTWSGYTNWLVEYYCSGGVAISELHNCADDGKVCSNGACVSGGCTDDCNPSGKKRCSGSFSQTCGNYDSDSCLEWNSGTNCQYGCDIQTGNCNSCTPVCSCASSTCVGSTCPDGCNGNCQGTKQPSCPSASTVNCGLLITSANNCLGCSGTGTKCPDGKTCNTNTWQCVSSCTPNCLGKQCGPDGCSGICGTCLSGQSCSNGVCVSGGCTESWSCGPWNSCSGGIQTRSCTDANSCGTTNNKPQESQSCIAEECIKKCESCQCTRVYPLPNFFNSLFGFLGAEKPIEKNCQRSCSYHGFNCPPKKVEDCNEEEPDDEIKCCVCNYWMIDETCEERSWLTCNKKVMCEWDWTGWFQGICKTHSSFKKACDNWFKKSEQKDCDQTAYVGIVDKKDSEGKLDINLGDPTGGLKGCTSLNSEYIMHGSSSFCKVPFCLITVCTKKLPSCKDFKFDYTACKIFDDVSKALSYAESLKKNLGGEKCVKISANQCTDSINPKGGKYPSRFIITIDSTGVCGTAGDCDFGNSCAINGESAYCRDKNTEEINCKKCKKKTWIKASLLECEEN